MLLIPAAPFPIVLDTAELSRWEDDGGSSQCLAAAVCPEMGVNAGTADWDQRIEQMMGQYGAAKQRRQVERAMRMWEEAEADLQLAAFEAPEERVH